MSGDARTKQPRWRPLSARRLIGWFARSWWREVLFVAMFYIAYEGLRALRHPSPAAALERGRAVEAVERTLHIAVERGFNEFTTAHATVASVTGYYYATLHFVVTPLVLIWLWRRGRSGYSRWRTVLAVTTLAGLVTYWLLPVAPPRFALSGMTDTIVARDIFGAGEPHGVGGLVNLYAALPSLHVAWAFWVALALFCTSGHALRWLLWLYPAATTAVVVATANHFLLDAVAGVVLVLAAYAPYCVTAARRRVRRAAPPDAVGVGSVPPYAPDAVRVENGEHPLNVPLPRTGGERIDRLSLPR